MDVTHVRSFHNAPYIHTTKDTSSGFIFTTAHSGEGTSYIISHCSQTFAVLSLPKQIKTDSGPGYTSKTFQQFCHKFQIAHVTGIPYNPQEGIVERVHRILKLQIQKQKGGISFTTPQNVLNQVLFTLNFLNTDDDGQTATERFWPPSGNPQAVVPWKDPLTNEWHGPESCFSMGPGACLCFS